MRETATNVRLTRMLAEDKEEMNAETQTAAVRDFQRVADEYFETDGKAKLEMKKDKEGAGVTLTFHVVRVKNFTMLK